MIGGITNSQWENNIDYWIVTYPKSFDLQPKINLSTNNQQF